MLVAIAAAQSACYCRDMSAPGHRSLVALIVAASVVWHLLVAVAPPAPPLPEQVAGAHVVRQQRTMVAAAEGRRVYARAAVPAKRPVTTPRSPAAWPLLWWGKGLPSLSLVWWGLSELALGASLVLLWRRWQPMGDAVGPALATALALSFGTGHALLLGHDAPVALALLVAAAVLAPTQGPGAGLLAGVALPLAPAGVGLLVVWAAQRRLVAAAVAIAGAVALGALGLALGGSAAWSGYVGHALPALFAGSARIGHDHALASLLPLSPGLTVPALATAMGAAVVAWSRPTDDPVTRGAQWSAALLGFTLVAPVATDAALSFALPAMALAAIAVVRGQLVGSWAAVVGIGWALLTVPTPSLEQLGQRLLTPGGAAAWAVGTLPTLGAVAILLATARVATRRT